MAESRVLVVDDDEAVRVVVRAGLERADISVVDACDGDTALRALASDAVDLVVLDWHLPGMSGGEILTAIKHHHPRLPVVVCTGAGDAERDVALELGAIDHITKARPLAELVRLVESVLAGDHEPALPGPGPVADGPGAGAVRAELAKIAHQLHNHLTVVFGHTDLARAQIERAGEDLVDRDQLLEDLAAVAAASERIGTLSRRLRELAGPEPEPAPDTRTAGPAVANGASPAATILVVEDDLDLRITTERLLRDEGYGVLTAADADAALALLRDTGPVDLCITDLLIPGTRPGEAAARVADAAPGTPLLVMSGYGADALGSSLAPPAAGFLAKPFTRDRLLDGIRSALRT